MKNQVMSQDLANTTKNPILLLNKEDMILASKPDPNTMTTECLALVLMNIRALCSNMAQSSSLATALVQDWVTILMGIFEVI